MTLAELVIAMGLSSLLLALACSSALSLWKGFLTQEELTYRQESFADLYTLLEEDIKNAGSDPLNMGLFKKESAVGIVAPAEDHAGGLQLRSDFTGADGGGPDGDADDAGERIVYAFIPSRATLVRWVDDGEGNLVPSDRISPVVAFSFALEDANGKPTSGSDAVQIQIAVSLATGSGDPSSAPRLGRVWRFGIRCALAP